MKEKNITKIIVAIIGLIGVVIATISSCSNQNVPSIQNNNGTGNVIINEYR